MTDREWIESVLDGARERPPQAVAQCAGLLLTLTGIDDVAWSALWRTLGTDDRRALIQNAADWNRGMVQPRPARPAVTTGPDGEERVDLTAPVPIHADDLIP